MAVYNFVVQLKDETSAPAKSAADSVAKLNEKMRQGQQAMIGLTEKMHAAQAAFRAIKDPTKAQTDAYRQQMSALSEQKTGMGDQIRRLNESRKAWQEHAAKVASSTDDAKARVMKYQHAVQSVTGGISSAVGVMTGTLSALMHGNITGAIGNITGAVSHVVGMLDLALPGLGSALSFVTGALGGLIGGIAGAVQSLMGFALHAAEGRQRTITLYNALEQGHATGEATAAMIGALGNKIGWTGGMLKPFAKELIAMGHRDLPDLRRELLATASAQAIMGEGGGAAYIALARKITHAGDATGKMKMSAKQLDKLLEGVGISANDMAEKLGISLTELDKRMKSGTVDAAQFGDQLRDTLIKQGKKPLEDFRNSLDGIGNRFTSFLGKLFSKVDVSPFLNALNEIVDAFGLDTKSGEGMVGAMNSAFQFAGDAAKWLVLAVLDVINWVLQAIITVRDWFDGIGTGGDVVNALKGGFEAMKTVVDAIGASIKLIGMALEPIAGTIGAISDAFTDMFGTSKTAKATDIAHMFPDPAAVGTTGQMVGLSFTQGLAAGIKAGTIEAVTAAKEMANATKDASTSALKIRSPSQVMREVGGHVATGFAAGIRGGTSGVGGAVSDMSRYTIASANDNAAGASSRGGAGGDTYNTFHVQIDGAGKSAEEITEEMLATTFEKLQLAAGA